MQRRSRSSFACPKAKQWTLDPGKNSISVSKFPAGAFGWSMVLGETLGTSCALSPCVCKYFRTQFCIHLSLKREQFVHSSISSANHSWIHGANVSFIPIKWKDLVSLNLSAESSGIFLSCVSGVCRRAALQTSAAVTCFMSARCSTSMLESARQRSLLRGVVPWELAVLLHIQPAQTSECKIPHLGVRCRCCALLWGVPGL